MPVLKICGNGAWPHEGFWGFGGLPTGRKAISRRGLVSATSYIERQLVQIRQGGNAVLFRKLKAAFRFCAKLPLLIFAIPIVVASRLIRPWLLVRWGSLPSLRIGHFALNTELYLCERDLGINMPGQRFVDCFFIGPPICNQPSAKM